MTIFIFVLILIIIIQAFIIYMLARKPKQQPAHYIPAREIAIQKNAEKEKENAETVKHIEKLEKTNVKNISNDTINNILSNIKL